MENIKFCIGDIRNATTYDELGESASGAVIKLITQENSDRQLLDIWEKIAAEGSYGGTK